MTFILSTLLAFLPIFAAASAMHCMGESDDVVFVSNKTNDRGWIGVAIQDMTPRLAKSMESDTKLGALVNDVIEESPAEAAGIKEKDIIVEFNGNSVDDADDLMKLVREVEPASSVDLEVVRNNEKKSLEITVGKNPHRIHAYAFGPGSTWSSRVRVFHGSGALGLELQELNKQLGEYFGAPENEGVLVTDVEEESAGAKAGFKAGDVILKVEGQRIREADDIWDEVEEYEKGDKVSFDVLRDKSRKTLTMEVEEDPNRIWFRDHGSNMRFDFDHDFDYRFELDELRDLEDEIEMEIERNRPELEKLRLELKEMGKEIREWGKDLKKKIEAEIRSVRS